MLKFNHARTIRLKFSLSGEKWFLEDFDADEEIKRLLRRNQISLPALGEVPAPYVYIRPIMEFLGGHKLDQSVTEHFGKSTLEIIITLGKRSKYTHSG